MVVWFGFGVPSLTSATCFAKTKPREVIHPIAAVAIRAPSFGYAIQRRGSANWKHNLRSQTPCVLILRHVGLDEQTVELITDVLENGATTG